VSNDQPEHRLSHWCIELCDRIVMTDQPSWWTAIDHSVKMSKDTPQAKMNFENHRKFMGIRPHHLDLYIYQYPWFAQIELKFAATRAAAEKALTTGQQDTMGALDRARVPNGYAWSVRSFYEVLCRLGFRLHANADNIVREIEVRYAAAQDLADIKRSAPPKKRAAGPGYQPKPSASRIRQVEAIRARVRF
jgi:hypothetical protein